MLKLYLFSVKFPFSSKPISVLTLYQYLPSFSSLSTTISGTLLTTTLEYLLFKVYKVSESLLALFLTSTTLFDNLTPIVLDK